MRLPDCDTRRHPEEATRMWMKFHPLKALTRFARKPIPFFSSLIWQMKFGHCEEPQMKATKASVGLDKKLRNQHRIVFHHRAWRRKVAFVIESAGPRQCVVCSMKVRWEDVWWGLWKQEVHCLVCYCSGLWHEHCSTSAVFCFLFN